MKILLRITAIILAVATGILTPVQALAASSTQTYISEFVTVSAKSADEAKKKLSAKGYTIVDGGDLNSTLDTGVYLGYKTTDEASEAITDAAVMNMKGKYSYSDYEEIMSKYREKITATVDGFTTGVAEYQTNYENGAKNAVLAHAALNLYINDDSKTLMGDYLLDYDFSDAAEKKLTDTLMQANSTIVLDIMSKVSFASDTEEDTTLVDRMAETGPDGIEKEFLGKYATYSAARQAMAEKYGSVASILYDEWDGFYTFLKDTEEKYTKKASDGTISLADGVLETEEDRDVELPDDMTDDEKEFFDTLDELSEEAENASVSEDFMLYTLLLGTKFGKGTLLDYFMRPAEKIEKSDLYVIVDSMSDGQRGQIAFTGIKELLIGAYSAKQTTDESEEELGEKFGDFEPVSIFSGVDRSVYESGVAFTDEATRHENLTGDSWIKKLTGSQLDKDDWRIATIVSWSGTFVLIGAGFAASYIQNLQKAKALVDRDSASRVLSAYSEALIEDRLQAESLCRMIDGGSMKNYSKYRNHELVKEYQEKLNAFRRADDASKSAGKAAGYVKIACFALLVVALFADAYTLYKYFTEEEPTEENIPHHLLTSVTTHYGDEYVYYNTVKDLSGNAADLNNHEADKKIGWLVLYTTKDANAGSPITSDGIKVITGSHDFGEDDAFVHLFNEESAINVTSDVYTGAADKAKGTYIVFSRDGYPYTASAVSEGTTVLIGVAGLVLGTLIGVLASKLGSKKKEKKTNEA